MSGDKITIAAHSGVFHADDIMAVATLLLVLKGKEGSVVRSRDLAVIDSCDYAVDVGGVYDPDKNRFDHHQLGGAGKRENTIPYAAFGLVWKRYGEELCGSAEIAEKIDQKLVQPVDAIDNGIPFVEPLFPNLRPYEIGDMFDTFNPTWKEEDDNIDEVFLKNVEYARSFLQREIVRAQDEVEARSIVRAAYDDAIDKRLIVLDAYYPWGNTLSELTEPLFAVFPRRDGTWSINAVRSDKHTFLNRKDLPEGWAGKSGEELERITGVPGAIFCHNARFIAGANTKEAILQMAEIALNS